MARLASAVDSALTDESLREVLLGAVALPAAAALPAAVWEGGAGAAALERAATELCRRIVGEFFAEGPPEDSEGEQLLPTVPGGSSPRGCCAAPPDHLSLLFASLEDPAPEPLPTRVVEVGVQGGRTASVALACPQCRRPLEIEAGFVSPSAPPVESEGPAAPARAERHAFCSALCDGTKQSFLQALLLGESLVRSGSTKDRVLLHGPAAPEAYLRVLARLWDLRPLRAWPRLPGRRAALAGRGAQLHCLELAEYDKVLLLEPGVVARKNLDRLFGLRCPAGAFSKAPGKQLDCAGGRLDSSLLLLRPSAPALKRIVAEVGSRTGIAWPPRGCEGTERQGQLEAYLAQFYETFLEGSRACFDGAWAEVPVDLLPVTVTERGKADTPGSCYNIRARQLWETAEQGSGEGGAEPACAATALLASLASSAGEGCRADCGKSLAELVKSIEAQRCKKCGGYDSAGMRDPIDHLWRCRFCWEGLLLDGFLHDGCDPLLPPAQQEQLELELGACYAGPGRQRWGWSSGGQNSWIEFRPGGVLWTEYDGVGAWQALDAGQAGRARLAVHLGGGDRGPEVRHVLQLSAASVATEEEGGGSGRMELEELYREVWRPLGFGRASLERKVRCWLLGPRRRPTPPSAGGDPAKATGGDVGAAATVAGASVEATAASASAGAAATAAASSAEATAGSASVEAASSDMGTAASAAAGVSAEAAPRDGAGPEAAAGNGASMEAAAASADTAATAAAGASAEAAAGVASAEVAAGDAGAEAEPRAAAAPSAEPRGGDEGGASGRKEGAGSAETGSKGPSTARSKLAYLL